MPDAPINDGSNAANKRVDDNESKMELLMATDVCESFPTDDTFTGIEVELAVEKYLAE